MRAMNPSIRTKFTRSYGEAEVRERRGQGGSSGGFKADSAPIPLGDELHA